LQPESQSTPDFSAPPPLHTLPGIIFSRSCIGEKAMQFLSPACQLLTEYSPEMLLTAAAETLSFNRIIYSEDFLDVMSRIEIALQTQQPYTAEYRIRTQTGQQKWLLEQGVIRWHAPTIPLCIDGLITDITALKQLQTQLQRDAFFDKLTHLPNRSLFMDRLTQAFRRLTRKPDYLFAVLFIDLDRFKLVNDSLGHRVGDQLLFQVAQKLKSCIRPGDTVARLGGDEFTMLIEDVHSLQDVTQISERIHREVSVPFVLEGQDVFTTTSIGIALSTPEYTEPEELLRDADIALYQAKALGRSRYSIFQSGMHIHALARLQLETDLRWAIQRQEFSLLYQPIISLESGQVTGLEVFVYWQHPSRGLLAPLEFLPIAEETGLIVQIGQWVRSTACRQMQEWSSQFPQSKHLFISVNLSAQEMADPSLVEHLTEVLQESALCPHRLKLEITEGTLLKDSEPFLAQLHELKELGIQLCIDDFGTGYSSLSYLSQFPIDCLKIDRSFIQRLEFPENLEIVRTIVTLSQNLGLKTIAEGVESTAQLAQLRALRCEFGQGYTFARPQDTAAISTFLEQQLDANFTTLVTLVLPRLLIHSPSGCYQMLLIGRTAWTLGRSPESAIFLADRIVSREHAILLQLAHSGEFYLVDLGSRNGSFLNQQRIKTPTPLRNGDRIQIGKSEIEFRAATSMIPEENTAPAIPTVLIHQSSKLQGQIWRDVLIEQGVAVIWQSHDMPLEHTLQQLEASGESLPNLLLVDVASLQPDLFGFFEFLRSNYANLSVMLSKGMDTSMDESLRAAAVQAGALDLLPGFRLRGSNLLSNATDIVQKVALVLEALNWPPTHDAIEQSAINALQALIRNETLF
jgi:diguanylate cyclase (GGDEF)-like protein